MRQYKPRKIAMWIILAVITILSSIFAIASGNKPYFSPDPPSVMTCYQNSICLYDFNATDDESDPLNYSINKVPFLNYLNPNTGILNFTPTNADVGEYNLTLALVQETDTGEFDYALINWTIVNVNDPPNITAHYPENLTNATEKEGYWIEFNVTVDDPDIIYGDSLNYTWYIDGVINKTLLNYTDNFANYTPDYFSAGIHNITVNVSDESNASDNRTWIVNITNENRAPVNNATILNITMTEDTPLYDTLNLSDYFYDNDTDDYPLSYDFFFIGWQNITILINATEPNNISLFPYLNFFGTNLVRFRCFDGYNYTLSNNVTINVTGVNDPPSITQVPNQTAYADTVFNLQIHASDPDYDTLTYYDNATIFDINPSNGFISDTFTSSEINNYTIEINVSDGVTNVSMVFNLSVINNTAPVLGGKPVPDIVTTEGNNTIIDFNATDVDDLDTLVFNTSSVPSNPKFNIVTTNNSAQGAKGRIQFTPVQADVGAYTVTINVTDNKGAKDTDTFTITVLDLEHPPVLRNIENQRMKVNKSFSLTIYADDEDGNINVFGDNTSLFDITKGGDDYNATGSIGFTPNDADFGEHRVNITVNDDAANYDWQLVLFNVTFNTPPTVEPIPNQTAVEDSVFAFQVNASDPDPQDTLIYYDNTTLFNISNTTGLISFIPNSSQNGDYVINITVSDGDSNVSVLMNLTIGKYNDFPYWTPPLDSYFTNESHYKNTTYWNSTNILNHSTNMTVWNSSIYEKNYTHVLMDAYDEEYNIDELTLSFTRTFINFTNASNDAVTSGIELFDISSYDGDTARVNFTPNNSQVGVYYVNLTVDDTTGRTNTTTLRLEVFNVNDAPIILNYSPNITYYVNMTENASMIFNVTAIDIDYGDELRYQWAVNGTNRTGANTSTFNYTTNFLSAGWRNITVFLIDESNATTMLNWTVNVSNVNRIGWFGEIRQYNYTHFNIGVTKSNVTILPGEEGIILANSTPTAYRPTGLFESAVLDTTETNNFHRWSIINWTGNLTPPATAQYTIYFQTRTATGLTPTTCPSTISQAYNESVFYTMPNVGIIATDPAERCIQYRFIAQTNNTEYTPNIKTVTLTYTIADKVQEQSTNQSWIDLDSYFYEPDTDDTLNFTVTTVNGTALTDLNISINNATHKAYVATNSVFTGSTQVVFHMSDGYNTTDSNVITINVTESQSVPIVIVVPMGGGGGAVSNPVPYEVPKYISTPVSFRLITPQALTTYINNTMEVPINLFNSNFTLNNIKIKATSPNENVKISLSKEFIPSMQPNQKEFLMMTVESYKTYGMYEILVEASAEATAIAEDGTEKKSEFNEKAKIFVNSLLKAEDNESQVNTKLAFAQDLLSSNPECLELNEFLKKARQLIADGKPHDADAMLAQIIESCKYLIAPKEAKPAVEAPTKVYGMATESAFILVTVAAITLIVAIALIIGWAHIKAKKKELTKKIE
jgi:hypothetical protein